ncbi:hypothetical protein BJ165DRAFT_136566 [Panaeolus papilionaceus]|nr:hypothetical protein BJ165DRAFT_136566 [Panaeolus papilionaceus]
MTLYEYSLERLLISGVQNGRDPNFSTLGCDIWRCLVRNNGVPQAPKFNCSNCRLFIWWHITFGGPALMSILVNCILALRLYALYERKKSVLVVLCSLIATEILCHIYVIVRLGPMVTNSVFTLPPEIPVLGCLTAGPPLRFTLIAWIPAVVLALIFFSMMVYKIQSQIFISIRQSKALALNSGPAMCFSPLLKTFWMDGISSFVLVSASTIVSTVLCLSTTGPFLALSQPWQTLIVSVSGTRLLLHIREVSASGDPLSVGVSRPLEPIRFASRNLDQNANLSMTPDVHHSV